MTWIVTIELIDDSLRKMSIPMFEVRQKALLRWSAFEASIKDKSFESRCCLKYAPAMERNNWSLLEDEYVIENSMFITPVYKYKPSGNEWDVNFSG